MMFYVYILYSEKSGIYYIGSTDNVERRFLLHNELSQIVLPSCTAPGIMASFPVGTSRGVALKIERKIKTQKQTTMMLKKLLTNTKPGSLSSALTDCRDSRSAVSIIIFSSHICFNCFVTHSEN